MDNVVIRFLRGSAPYEPGDTAGFAPWRAAQFIGSGAAVPATVGAPGAAVSASPVDRFSAMSRAELVAYARDHLGMVDEPPADVPDHEIRTALRDAPAPAEKAKGRKP